MLGDVLNRQMMLGGAVKEGDAAYESLWLYILGPMIGGILAGAWYKMTHQVIAKIKYDEVEE